MSGVPLGVLLLDKPLGLSSNAALQRVRRLAGGVKAGHTGSLDPLASGMLPICLGEATKLAGEMLALGKAYRFGVQLGERSDTGDAEGAIIERAAIPSLSRTSLESLLARFMGEQQQIPPMYSALKRDGQPLYRLARQGITLERSARRIVIEALELLGFSDTTLELRVVCSKGTYVRVLAEDLARALGSCGRLFSLRREYVQPFEHERMYSLEQLETWTREHRAWPLLSADAAVQHLPQLRLDSAAVSALGHGQSLPGQVSGPPALWRLYASEAGFIGLGQSDASGTLRVRRLFTTALQAGSGSP